MGEIIFSYNDLKGNTLAKPTLKLEAVVGTESFFYQISEKEGDRSVVCYWKFSEKLPSFLNPCSYLPEVFSQEELLFEGFDKVNIAIADVGFFLIPNKLLLHLKPRAILSRVAVVPAGDQVFVQPVQRTGQSLIYSVPGKLLNELQLYFGKYSFTHLAQCLIQLHLEKVTEKVTCLIYLLADRFFLSVARQNQVVFARMFPWRSSLDVLYFSQLILQSFGLDDKERLIQVCGPFAAEDILETLQPYYPMSRFVPDLENTYLKPHYRVVDLYSLRKCG